MLPILSVTATGTTCTDNTVHHSPWYYLYRRQIHLCCQYCPQQPLILPVQAPNTPLLSILSTTTTDTTCTYAKYDSVVNKSITATGTTCTDAKYNSTVNTFHQSHCCQYCVLQPLVLPVQTHNAPLFSITVHRSHWYYLYRRQIHLCLYCPLQPLVLLVQTPNTPLLSILSTSATGPICTDAKYTSIVNTVHHSPSQPLVLPVQTLNTPLLAILSTIATGTICTVSSQLC